MFTNAARCRNVIFSAALTTFGILSTAEPVLAVSPACDSLGGGVIFKDMLYGVGTGLVLTGLGMAAADHYDHAGQKLAVGSSIGAGLGIGVGAVELLMRDCHSTEIHETRIGWQRPRILFPSNPASSIPGIGLSFAYVMPTD